MNNKFALMIYNRLLILRMGVIKNPFQLLIIEKDWTIYSKI